MRKLLFVLSLLVLAVGCSQGDLETLDTEGEGGASVGASGALSTHSFGREVQLSFFDPVEGVSVPSPVMMVPPEKAEEFRRAMEVRAQETTFTTLRQITYPQGDGLPGLRGPLITNDPSGYPTCHTPRSPNDIIFGGVVDDQGILYIGFEAPPGDYGVTYTWTLPQDDSDKPTLVGVEPLGYYINGRPEYLEAQGNTVIVRYEITKRPFIEGSDYLPWDVRVYVNGVVVENRDEFHPGTANLYVLPPVFKSLAHGLHSIHYAAEGGSGLQVGQSGPENESATLEYFQRGLVFTEPLPAVDPQSPDPVHIQNTIAWSDGIPLDDSAVSWIVRSPVALDVKTGTGKQIDAIWDPIERTMNQEAEGDDEDFEPVPYLLSARTDVYPDRTNPLLRDLVYEVTSADFNLPGQRKIKIINESISPDPPFEEPGSSVTLEAEIALINLDVPEEKIVWEVTLLDSEGNGVGGVLEDGIGKDVEATWDGTIDGVPVENPTEYSFRIFVQVCNEADGGPASRRAPDTRLQGLPIGECVVANLKVPLKGSEVTIEEIQFAGASAVSPSLGESSYTPGLYYRKLGEVVVHHPVLIDLDALAAASSGVSPQAVGEGLVKVSFSGEASGQEDRFEFQVHRPGGELLGAETVTVPAQTRGSVIRGSFSFMPELERKVQSIEFIKVDVRRNGGEWIRDVAGLSEPVYVGIRSPRPPFGTSSGPTKGMLDIATFLARDATTEGEVRSRMLQRMPGWLEGKGFIYNPAVTHTEIRGFKENSPGGGTFSYRKFMRGFNGERRFWEGDCEDVSALYATANLALGSDMRLMRLTGPPVLSPLGVPVAYDDTFQTNLIRANAVGVGDADLFGAFGPPPPKFEKWTFTAHQVATWDGKVWDPTFTYGSEASPFLINGSTISAYLSTALSPDSRYTAHPSFELDEIL